MIKPTVGRRVHYWPGRHGSGTVLATEQPFDAGIAYVYGDRMVNISYVDHYGTQFAATSVRLVQEGDERPSDQSAFCEWMPFQVGQAKAAAAQ